ncbi:TPA: DUF1302 domain-containing protein [Pseudomonas aeruginosa]|nr:DUF1302 domain-containing protein [Pseudomonas aeruginosa]
MNTNRLCAGKLSSALFLSVLISAQTYAVTFNIGEIEGQLDSSLLIGAIMSARGADPDLIGSSNGGTGFTQTGDDGRLNFKKGETTSKIFKGIHDLELKYGDTGFFMRGKYWYDFELKDESRTWKEISDHGRKQAAQSSGAQVLDAFIYHNYSFGDIFGTLRLGKQVVNWGESTFIQNGINSINPIDVAAFRRPGAEIKEGLIPVNMFYASQNLTDQLTAEAFYQLEWDQTVLDNCGTFFSGSDIAAEGCDENFHIFDAEAVGALMGVQQQLSALGVDLEPEGLIVPRGGDRDARDSGQFGTALRWMGGEAEYAAYFINYHSRTPYLSVQNASATDIIAATTILGGALAAPILVGRGNYFLEYPEDIQLYGLSFSTTLPTGTAWTGEISYRPNQPLQINGTDQIAKLVTSVAAGLASGGIDGGLERAGDIQQGYVRKEVTQAQTTLVHFLDQFMGADRLTLIGEFGVTHIGGLESQSEIRYGRDSIYGSPYGDDASNVAAQAAYGVHGFYTNTSWGYRARAVWDYNNVIAGINLKPNLSWSHDVDGYGPVFNEGAKAISVGLDADYGNTYSASLSYTDFFGGDFNPTIDRDFVAVSFGISF